MITLGEETRRLDCELTYDEKLARAQRAAEISELAGSEKERAARLKEESAALTKQAEAHAREAAMLLSYYKSEVEPRDVRCELGYESDTGDVVMVRTDTHRTIERRKPTGDEWTRIKQSQQRPLFPARSEWRADAATRLGSLLKDEEPKPTVSEPKPPKAKKVKRSEGDEVSLSVVKDDETSLN